MKGLSCRVLTWIEAAFKGLRVVSFSAALCLSFPPATRAQTTNFVVPAQLENIPGEAAQAPFRGDGIRWQNVYAASHFQAAMPEGGIITGISLRLDEQFGNGTSTTVVIPELEIRASTAQTTYPNWSGRFFEDNVGLDQTAVFPRGALQVQLTSIGSGNANPFSINIPFVHPFSYDPRRGDLVIDFFTYDDSDRGFAVDSTTQRAFAFAGSVNDPQIRAAGAVPVTQFTVLPVPEPTTWVLLANGASILLMIRRRTQSAL